ncbi:unnamed protein product [Hermetia illucens]|uniref:Uncharacterized protein n=1 Tax=Hermetia illucens TaxID=343691 RepID=A0A7R8UHU3_HERIL|nr:cuticle protein 64-like [Hermetia illucens]XP_037907591.1 cuticle protein 64-like [Hermetia illucens]CAD7080898.1 unnamed protein product [Hermetia illucens]CAD7080899.1 unnamed protein product [Hermetia illucens]
MKFVLLALALIGAASAGYVAPYGGWGYGGWGHAAAVAPLATAGWGHAAVAPLHAAYNAPVVAGYGHGWGYGAGWGHAYASPAWGYDGVWKKKAAA